MTAFLQDLRFALRQLRRSPGSSLVLVLTLALGIGSASAVFSVIDAVLLRPLPFAHQDRLVFPETFARQGYTQPWSWLSYRDARSQLKTFQALAGYSDSHINLESSSGPISLPAVEGTDNFFTVFGIAPLLGRTFAAGEDQPGRDTVAVLSYELWKTHFGGSPDILGKPIRLDGVPSTIIGVMPAGFRFPLSARNAIYKPLNPDPQLKSSRGSHWMHTVGLLQPGVSREQAQADLNLVLHNLARTYPETDTGRTARIIPLLQSINGDSTGPLKILLLAVVALLGIACVNVAGLLLARGIRREREMALRAAVGASRARLVRQVVSEGLVLSAAGLLAGIALSWALLTAIRSFLISALARGAEVHLNAPVLLFALLLSALTSLAASLAPALRLSGTDPNAALRTGTATGASRSQLRLRSGFVVTQVALSLVLLAISGLLLRNLHARLNTPLGFDPSHILAVPVQLSPGDYTRRDPRTAFYTPLLDRVSHLPGVEAAGLINLLPIQSWGSNSDVHIAGQPPYPPNQEMLAENRTVSPGYFDAMGIHLLRGRQLSPSLDTPDLKSPNIVVNQAFQKKFFPHGGDPVGARTDNNDHDTVVGMVTNVRQSIWEPPLAEMDYLMNELPSDYLGELNNMTLVVRSTGDPTSLIPSIRNAMHQVDPSVPFITPESMTSVISESLVFDRLQNWLFGLFAACALLLATVGLYGLTSHEVELRTRDIGIRMALGSSRALVVRGILSRVALLLALGIAAGWGLTFALHRVLASLVELHPSHDLVLVVALTALLLLVGLTASLFPACRASSIDPIQALRTE